MGLEASCACRVGPESGTAKVLLESTVLILRGAIRRRYDVAALHQVQVVGAELRFSAGAETVALELGAAQAARWAAKLGTPPPTLAAKLGVGPANKAFVLGPVDDTALEQALRGAQTGVASEAGVLVAVVRSPEQLLAMIEVHRGMPSPAVWVVHPKGRAATLGDSAVRHTLRAQGYRDNKTTAVSEALTATRYTRP